MAGKKEKKEEKKNEQEHNTITLLEFIPLESGDRLTRELFERRYKAMTRIKKAELIEGVVYMSPLVRNSHSQAHGQIITWLGVYCAASPGVIMNVNSTVRLDTDNEVQPDALLRFDSGGRSKISGDDIVSGAPEMIAEIVSSSASYDLHDKMNVYRRIRVQEYLVWLVHEKRVDWFHYNEGRYYPLWPDADDIIQSEAFPGLNLSVKDLLEGNFAAVLDKLQKGLGTKKHESFIRQLKEKRRSEIF
ncbi:MAG: Uma2 family endonuclease [Desulfobacterales bacterium]|nr:Uma2 family endonuclease [Desulfobacterales bacterium]